MYDFVTYEPVIVGDWLVKVSKLGDQVQVFLYNPLILESQIQWFYEEYEAVLWIDYMCAKYV